MIYCTDSIVITGKRVKQIHVHLMSSSLKGIEEELLCDVVAAVAILKRQIKLVFLYEHRKAVIRLISRAAMVPTPAVDVHLDIPIKY